LVLVSKTNRSSKTRAEILALVVMAFTYNMVDGAGLSLAEWDWAEHEIETVYGGDFEAVAKAVKAEMAVAALVCRLGANEEA
jgi:hypothetical protein